MVAESALLGNSRRNAARLCLLCLALLAFLAAGSVEAEAQPRFDAQHVGGPGSHLDAELWQPNGQGPWPAVVVLHGCDGMRDNYRVWAQRLRDWGYAALLIDSFGPRGFRNICSRGGLVPPSERLKDAYRGADYLRGLSDIRPDRIGVIGFSHGGWTVLNLVLRDKMASAQGRPFAAAVAYYPGCEHPGSPLVSDTLILMGDQDDWTPVANCRRWESEARPDAHWLEMIVYSGARHAFDSDMPLHDYLGHRLGRDDTAAPLAAAETKRFFDQRLKP